MLSCSWPGKARLPMAPGSNERWGWEGKQHSFTVQMRGRVWSESLTVVQSQQHSFPDSFQLAFGEETVLTGDLLRGQTLSISELEIPHGEAPLRSGTFVLSASCRKATKVSLFGFQGWAESSPGGEGRAERLRRLLEGPKHKPHSLHPVV